MKAPEKIYIQSFNVSEEDAKFERLLYFDDVWTEHPEPGMENIEYTRTEAFIEKACEWLKENAGYYVWRNKLDVDCGICDEFFNDFKKAMEEE